MSIDVAAGKLKAWRNDTTLFAREAFNFEPDAWQLDVFRAFDGQQPVERIAMQACAGPGKSAVMAILGLKSLACHADKGKFPNGFALSITGDNLRDGLWKELAVWYNRSEFFRSAFEFTSTSIHSRDYPETWWLRARAYPKTADPETQGRALDGLHAPYIFYLLDETGGMHPALLRKAEQGLNNCEWGRLVLAGNPTSTSGALHTAVNDHAGQYRVIRITGDPDDPKRSPRINIEWARTQIAQYGRDNPWVQSYILGLFPAGALNTLLTADEVRAAMERNLQPDAYDWSQKRLGIDVARFGDDRCFDDETEILTDEGWKLFADLHGREQVMSLNGDTAVWGAISHIHKAPFDGHLNVHESRHLNFAVTDNHRMLVRTSPKKESYTFRPFRELPKEFVVRGWNGWGGTSPRERTFTTRKVMPKGGVAEYTHTFDFLDWAEFLGWFVSEGNVYRERRVSGRLRVLVAQNPGAKQQELLGLMDRMGIRYRLTTTKRQVEFTSASIGQWLLDHCGHGASNKRVPAEIQNGSSEAIKAFLRGFALGDGTQRADGTGRCYITSSCQLADDVQGLLAKIGRAGMLRRKNVAGSETEIGGRRVVRLHDTYVVYERGFESDKYCHRSDIKRVPYTGFVWCVATPLESIYVRRRGIPMWSGNTVLWPRQGLVAFRPSEMRQQNTNAIAAKALNIIAQWEAQMTFVDDTGHWGHGVVDNLLTSGASVIPVNFADRQCNQPRYFNKRAEMWFEMADWVKRGGCLPNMPELIPEFTVPTYYFQDGKVRLVEKDEIKKLLDGRSPDYADALALTFALPDMPGGFSLQEGLASGRIIPGFSGQGGYTAPDYDPYDPRRF